MYKNNKKSLFFLLSSLKRWDDEIDSLDRVSPNFQVCSTRKTLEKIGLPVKPSMRGGNWVVDGSHCQGCSSQFTFINRKHHCRRCGGLFCNSCTQQRMVLRGQGDAPVRICEPCKRIEEAARFELRYGHRKQTAKVNAKQAFKHEDEVPSQILGTDGKHASLSEQNSNNLVNLDLKLVPSSASCSSSRREGDNIRSVSVDTHNNLKVDLMLGDPEELHQQAVEEKRKYKTLKAEGKSEEALQAFKRGKELERQAGALEITLRKNRRMAAKASNFSTVASIQKIEGHEEFGGNQKLSSQTGTEVKDDLAAELRELGWSDADLHDADKRPAKLSLEGELSNLLALVSQKSSQGIKKGGVDKSEVIALKKRALFFKREGKLSEAKEELKRAKLLEKQIEEQELLGDAEESDDELHTLINSLDEDKQDNLALDHVSDARFQFDNQLVFSDDLPIDGNFEVTDDDMNNPDLVAALKSFGWSDEDEEQPASQSNEYVPFDREALCRQVLSLKREALSQKRDGNISEAMELLKKSKLLEKDLEGIQCSSEIVASEFKKSSSPQVDVAAMQTVEEENVAETTGSHFKSPPKSKLMVQKELLALKKRVLTFRREGRIDEAEEELKKGKILEQHLEEMESAPRNHGEDLRKEKVLEQLENMKSTHRKPVAEVAKKNLDITHVHEGGDTRSLNLGEERYETEVTEQDMHDPAFLSLLKNMGWNEDDDVDSVGMTNRASKQMNDPSTHDNAPPLAPMKAKRSKADIQKELLAIKRKALALRRQGRTEEAEEELEKAKALETQMTEMEVSSNVSSVEVDSLGFETLIPQNLSVKEHASGDARNTAGSLASFALNKTPKDAAVPLHVPMGNSTLHQSNQSLNLECLSGSEAEALHSSMRGSVKREGTDANLFSITSAPVMLAVESTLKEKTSSKSGEIGHTTSHFQSQETDATETNNMGAQEQKVALVADAFRDEILARKRKAVALKREGKLAEAREELRQAKLLEKSLEDGQQADVVMRGALTPDSTALKQENIPSPSEKPKSGRDRFRIQQESLSHKRNALKLRREGKIDESEAELELAKALEKQLEDFDQGSSTNMTGNKSEAMDDVVVEDLLDPQLLSALKAIGLEDSVITSQPYHETDAQPNFDRSGNQRMEKADLEEQIKAEKHRALNFKRAGKQAEALEALRSAKRLEKNLATLT
ncbi:uncharacterized protein LOC135586192 isoform X1 [Musa acuminata AAA Group]|uniref:uncharacterized protein LOC135586192 isoform X1 n=2 Tax=Musa acuminata AAA Group TaxID=214697 RepID=UPI0031E21C78